MRLNRVVLALLLTNLMFQAVGKRYTLILTTLLALVHFTIHPLKDLAVLAFHHLIMPLMQLAPPIVSTPTFPQDSFRTRIG
jgi:hypothetical protein